MIGHVDNDMLKIVDLHSGPFDLTSDDIQQISDVDIQESFYENMVYNDRTLLPYYLSNFNYLVEKYKYLEEDIHNLIDDLEEFDEFEEDVVIQNFDAEYFLVIMPNIEIDNTGILINSYEFLSKQFPESKNIFETQMIQRWEKSLYKLL